MKSLRPTLISFFVAWCVGVSALVLMEARFPGADVFQFKLPAVELATRGTLTGVNLPNSPLDQRVVYAFYPPLYPVILGSWFKIFGIGYGSSVIFDCVWRLIRSVCIGVWIMLLVSPKKIWAKPQITYGVLAFLLILSFLPNNEDRPDEMGLCFSLLSLWVILRSEFQNQLGPVALSGILLGLAAASSPTAGIFGALMHCVWFGVADRKKLIRIALVSLFIFGVICLPVIFSDPTAVDRFLRGARYNVLPHSQRSEFARMGHRGFTSLIHHLSLSFDMGRPMFVCLFFTGVASIVFWRHHLPGMRRLLVGALLFSLVSLIVFSVEPLYLWFSCSLMWVVILSQWFILPRPQRLISIGLSLLAISLMVVRESKLLLDAFVRDPQDSLEVSQKLVQSAVKPGQNIATNAGSFFSVPLEISHNMEFNCHNIHLRFDWAWAGESGTFQRVGTRENIKKTSLCYWTPHCFEMVSDTRSTKVLTILGIKTPFYVRGFGGVLYKNICKETGVIPPF